MKKKSICTVLILILLASLCLPITALAADTYGIIQGGNLHMRNGPSMNAEIIATYRSGTWVRILGQDGDFYHVMVEDGSGNEGYMMAKYVIQETLENGTWGTVENGTRYVNLRTGPSTEYTSIGRYYTGDSFELLEYGDVFSKVRFGGNVVGYISTGLTSLAPHGIASAGEGSVSRYDGIPIQEEDRIRTYNNGKLNLRGGPSVDASILGSYPPGTEVLVLAEGSTWDKVYVMAPMDTWIRNTWCRMMCLPKPRGLISSSQMLRTISFPIPPCGMARMWTRVLWMANGKWPSKLQDVISFRRKDRFDRKTWPPIVCEDTPFLPRYKSTKKRSEIMNISIEKRAWILVLFLMLALCAPQAVAEDAQTATPQDDFYSYINAEWLAQAEIRPDRSSISAFSDASDKVLHALMNDFAAMLDAGEETGEPLLDMFLTYYAMVKDKEQRNADAFTPAADDYARIENLQSLDELSAQAKQWLLDCMPLPFDLGVGQDLQDVTKYTIHADMASAFLGDPAYYEPDNSVGQKVLPLLKDAQTALLIAAGATEEEAQAELQRAYAFDALLVAKTPSIEEQDDITRENNPTTIDDFGKLSQNIELAALAEDLVGVHPDSVNIMNKDFYDAFDDIYAPENFDNMKSWMKVAFLYNASTSVGDTFTEPIKTLNMKISGAQETANQDELDYDTAYAVFSDVVGQYYGRKYFGEDAKADVTGIVQQALEVYRGRLEAKDWLSDATKEMAIRKLDNMSIRVGYPDKLPTYYDLYAVAPASEGGTLYGNKTAMTRAVMQDQLNKYGTVPDRTQWIMPSDIVNAGYNPFDNSINFPAGILQAPFYSAGQSQSANLGGIGMVIGHEISHAFDNNGSKFDELGNMKNWWTNEDAAAFEERTKAMVSLFNGLPYAGLAVNGQLTLGENIADAGGISCMLDIVKTLPDVSLSDFFEAYADIWREKMTPEAAALILSDVHSPSPLRVNIQCGNAEAFYETYTIEETDAMYIAPEKRVEIW